MTAIDATRILLNRNKTTNKLRKLCQRARETSMRSATPVYREDDQDEFGNKTVEYYSSKPSEVTPEQRLAAKLRRASLAQLDKWARRNTVRQAACAGIVQRCQEEKHHRRRDKFIDLAMRHGAVKRACLAEIVRRKVRKEYCGN